MRRTAYPRVILWSGVAAVCTAAVVYAIGLLAVFDTTGGQNFVADTCMAHQDPYKVDDGVLDYGYLVEHRSLMPLSAPCNAHQDLVPGYVNPLFFTTLPLGAALLVAYLALWSRSLKPLERPNRK